MTGKEDIFDDLSLDLIDGNPDIGFIEPELQNEGLEDKKPPVKVNKTQTSLSVEDLIDIDEEEIPASEDDFDDAEDDKEKDSPTPPSDDKSHAGTASPPSQIYAAFAKKLAEDGVLSGFDETEFNKIVEEVGSPSAALVEMARRNVVEAIEDYKQNAEEQYKAFLEARDNRVPVDAFTSASDMIKQLEGMNDEDFEDDTEKAGLVVKQLMEAKGFKPAKIEKLIKNFEALGTLAEEAAEARTELLELKKAEVVNMKTEAKRRVEEAEKNARQQRESLKTFIESTDEIIPGVKVTKAEKEKLFKSITEPVGYTPEGQPYNAVMQQRSKNPVAFERMLHYLLQLGVFNTDDKGNPKPDWSKVVKVKQTQVADEFDTMLRSSSAEGFGGGKSAKTGGRGGKLDLGL